MSDRATYWQTLVAAWEQSGLTQAALYRRRGVKAVSFARWKRKLGGRTTRTRKSKRRGSAHGDANRRVVFVEAGLSSRVLAAGSGNAVTGYEIVVPSGLLIRLPVDFDPDQVSRRLHAVAAVC